MYIPDEPLPPPHSQHSSHQYQYAQQAHGGGVSVTPPHLQHHHHHHHLPYRVGPYGEEVVYDDDITLDQEKILEGDSPNTIFAKKRTKKFRLLNRMDDGPVPAEQTPLKGKDSNANNANANSDPSGTEKNTNNDNTHTPKTVDDPTATPGPGMVKGGKIISPNSSRSSSETSEAGIEYQEQRNPNAYRRVQHIPTTGMPLHADGDYTSGGATAYHHPHHRGGNGGATDIAPRIAHFDYIKNYAPAGAANVHNAGGLGPGATAFKTLTYAAGMRGDEYAAAPPHHPHHHPHMRRYLPPRLDMAAAAHGGSSAADGGGAADAAALAARRRVLKVAGAGPAGYWVNSNNAANEWAAAAAAGGGPPEYY